MVRPVANSYALTTLAAHEKPSDIIGGSLVCVNEYSTLQSDCPSVAFIYRYTSTRLEVRDFFDADSIYATLLSTALPSEQKLKVSAAYDKSFERLVSQALNLSAAYNRTCFARYFWRHCLHHHHSTKHRYHDASILSVRSMESVM